LPLLYLFDLQDNPRLRRWTWWVVGIQLSGLRRRATCSTS